MDQEEFIIAVHVSYDKNQTLTGHIVDTRINDTIYQQEQYDHTGAVYYILAVIFMYNCSILLMVGSFARKKNNDSHISTYMKDLEKLRRLELKQEKFRTILTIHKKKVGRETQLCLLRLFFKA